MHARNFVFILLPCLFAACSDNEPVKLTPAQAASSAGESSSPSATPGLPPGPATTGKALTFTPQEGWVVETPTSSMRKAQYKLPKQGNDADDATLVVTYFGGETGTVEANVARWAGQFEQPGGASSSDAGKKSTRKVNGMEVFVFDISGTLIAEMAGPSSQAVHKENWRAINAIVKSDHGPYFAKLSGPASTVAHWEPSFQKFLDAVKPQ
jgi:hypothetical protein